MTTAAILLCASCLWAITRSILCLFLTASPWRRMLVLAVICLACSCAHEPRSSDKNDKESSCIPGSVVVK